MDRKKKIASAAAIAIAATVIVSAAIYFSNPTGKGMVRIPVLSDIWHWKSAKTSPAQLPVNDPFSDKIVMQLQKYYSDTIADKATQAGLITVRDMVVGMHPDNGRAYFYSILRRAFPDYADDIMETLDKLDRYNRWLADNKDRLIKMTASARLAALWEKRKELFGRDAEKIWTGELLATEARQAKVQDTIAALNESSEMSMNEKLDVYNGVIHEAYEGTMEAFILDQGELLAKAFFSMDSIQEELKQMNPEDRQQEINSIRKKMGLTDEQVASLAKRDARNAQRWDNGMAYMEQREAVVKQYEGQEREEKLKELRAEYFNNEANTIALEEKDGFYRFERPHIWGRN